MIRDGHFAADAIMVDAYDFSAVTNEELEQIRGFAAEQGLEVWFSVSLGFDRPEFDERGIPNLLRDKLDAFAVVICLRPEPKHIHLQLVKDHEVEVTEDLHLKLDPKTLLIAGE